MLDDKLLERLCTACGISGDEGEVREIILQEIKPFADDIKVDALGNVIVFRKGRERAKRKLMISAHMDEVGFIVTDITSEGLLKFTSVGGINNSAAFAKQVLIGKNKIHGVVCSKPVHLLSADEKKKCPKIESLSIDIGAKSKEEAKQYVRLGDSIMFDSFYENKDGRIIAKALDDRFGCLVLITMIKSELPYDMYFTFCVQEEVGLRGSTAAAFTVAPDSAIVIEATTAADVPFAENEKRVCLVGGGAVVSFMDRASIYDKGYYDLAMEIAEKNGIAAQTKTMVAGGNDAGAIHRSRGGVRTAAVSVPCRYLHSSSSLISVSDAQAVYSLVSELAKRIAGDD
ncbi:MAG: M42 family peptidase [Clostridia bacterium]|nr:M42 family peptidase [Clostridia bacterium]